VITTDLPSARAHHFKSVEQDFSIVFCLNLHHLILEMDKDDCTSYFRHAIVIFMWFWLGGFVFFLFWIKVSFKVHQMNFDLPPL